MIMICNIQSVSIQSMPTVCYDGFSMHGEGMHTNVLQAYCNTGQCMVIHSRTLHSVQYIIVY